MHQDTINSWQQSHTFGQDRPRAGEFRTIIVVVITAAMMVVEITTGLIYGSMALLADGLHMASHAAALTLNAFAYVFARRHARDRQYSFGTGKVNALSGFFGAVLLAVFALIMAWESFDRMVNPVVIAFNQAIFVAVLGLIVNGASVFILGTHHDHDAHEHHHDHNLRAAYLHVCADALTSMLAIFALLAAKHLGLVWMDPVVGVVGAVLVSKWSLGLLRSTSAVLLDKEGPEHIRRAIQKTIEDENSRVVDLHVWSIGPNIYSVIVSVVARDPTPPDHYKSRLPSNLGLEHVIVEVNDIRDRT